jgi:hypothetical protein
LRIAQCTISQSQTGFGSLKTFSHPSNMKTDDESVIKAVSFDVNECIHNQFAKIYFNMTPTFFSFSGIRSAQFLVMVMVTLDKIEPKNE